MVLDRVLEDPHRVRALVAAGGPYRFQTRPGSLVWPTWRTEWASDGVVHLADAGDLFTHAGFVAAAAQMCGSDDVEPRSLYVNISTPCMGQPVSHTDLPQFRGVDSSDVPEWFLQVMGASRLFEDARITTVTAVSWFHLGPRGYYRYWPEGRDAPSVRHERMWNTAVVGDNDFMHHKVERIGDPDAGPPQGLSAAALLRHDPSGWWIDDGGELARYRDDEVRVSLSWTARVHDGSTAVIEPGVVWDRIGPLVADDLAARSLEELFGDDARHYLVDRWPGFLPG
ncbi:MAG: hypothetical protein AAF548_00660 [Actinomycetota bacterium]